MPSSKKLYLFSQIPTECVFAFESPDNPQFKKISDTQACKLHDGWYELPKTISPNILVFPVYPVCLLTEKDEALVSIIPAYWEEAVPPSLGASGADLGDWIEEELW